MITFVVDSIDIFLIIFPLGKFLLRPYYMIISKGLVLGSNPKPDPEWLGRPNSEHWFDERVVFCVPSTGGHSHGTGAEPFQDGQPSGL
jgi:hypothetical protein